MAWQRATEFGVGLLFGLGPFTLAKRRQRTYLGGPLTRPTATAIDLRLLVGSALFGVGWGLAGLCPRPALASLGLGDSRVLVFVAAMLGGMAVFEVLEWLRLKRASPGPAQTRS